MYNIIPFTYNVHILILTLPTLYAGVPVSPRTNNITWKIAVGILVPILTITVVAVVSLVIVLVFMVKRKVSVHYSGTSNKGLSIKDTIQKTSDSVLRTRFLVPNYTLM